MATLDLRRLLEFDVETRLALVQELWSSILEDTSAGAALPLSAEVRAVLEQRLHEDDADPDSAIPWTDAKDRVHRDR